MDTALPKDSLPRTLQRTFPPALVTLLQEILNPAPDFGRIAQLIKLDPALTANVLSLVNSPFYGMSQKVLDIQRASVILGIREILKIILSITLVEAFQPHARCRSRALQYWRLTIWSALAAQSLAEQQCPEKADVAYLCGMLKDIALLLPADGHAAKNDQRAGNSSCSHLQPEHAVQSRELLSGLNLPQEILEAIVSHHDSDNLKKHPALTQCLIMGTFWSEMELCSSADPLAQVRFKYMLQDYFSITSSDFESIREQILQRFTSLTRLLNMADQTSEARLFALSVETIQRVFFLSLDLSDACGGLESLARIIQKHLCFQWNMRVWELGLKWPRERQWSLFRCHLGEVLHEVQTYALPEDLAWTHQGHCFALTTSGQAWGELRIPEKFLDQNTLIQIGHYTRFLSLSLEQYAQRMAILEDKARILDKLPVGVAWLNASGRVMDANLSLRRLLGVDVVHGKDLYAALNTNGLVGTEAPWRTFIEDAGQTSMSALFCPPAMTPDISTPCLYLSAHKIIDEKRKDILVLLEDIKDVTELQTQLLKQRDFLRGLINAMRDMVMTTDSRGRITFTSSQLPPEVLGKNLFSVTKPVGDFAGTWDHNLLGRLTTPQEAILFLEGGPAIPLDLLFSSLPVEPGQDKEFLVVGRDLSTVRRLEEKLRQQAMFDDLTGLFNHRHFLEILDRETSRARRSKRSLSLIFFDLDRFKTINDTQGHQAGDAILRDIGKILRKIVRKGVDFPARYGGDEFAVLANETDMQQVHHLAERVMQAIEQRFQGIIGLSIGLAQLDAQESPQELLNRADRASYAAKQAGGNRIVEAKLSEP